MRKVSSNLSERLFIYSIISKHCLFFCFHNINIVLSAATVLAPRVVSLASFCSIGYLKWNDFLVLNLYLFNPYLNRKA